MSGSGKSTLATRLVAKLWVLNGVVIDSDVFRWFWPELKFSREDKSTNTRRLGCIAVEIARQGIPVIVACIAPYLEDRKHVCDLASSYGIDFHEVHLDASIEVLKRRRPHLYGLESLAKVEDLAGVDAPYEPPDKPLCRIDTGQVSPDDAAQMILDAWRQR